MQFGFREYLFLWLVGTLIIAVATHAWKTRNQPDKPPMPRTYPLFLFAASLFAMSISSGTWPTILEAVVSAVLAGAAYGLCCMKGFLRLFAQRPEKVQSRFNLRIFLYTNAGKGTAGILLMCLLLLWPPAISWLAATAALLFSLRQFRDSFRKLNAESAGRCTLDRVTTTVARPTPGDNLPVLSKTRSQELSTNRGAL